MKYIITESKLENAILKLIDIKCEGSVAEIFDINVGAIKNSEGVPIVVLKNHSSVSLQKSDKIDIAVVKADLFDKIQSIIPVESDSIENSFRKWIEKLTDKEVDFIGKFNMDGERFYKLAVLGMVL